jgi:hypothetical protein
MAKYHLNKNGDTGLCSAAKGNCPFGGDEDHFTSPEAARSAFEASQNAFETPLQKAKTAHFKALVNYDKAEVALNSVAHYEGLSDLTKEGAKYASAKERYEKAGERAAALKSKVEVLELEDKEGEKTEDFKGKYKVPHDFKGYNSNYDGRATYALGGTTLTESSDGKVHVSYYKPASLTTGGRYADSFEAGVKLARSIEKRNAEYHRKNPVIIRPWD